MFIVYLFCLRFWLPLFVVRIRLLLFAFDLCVLGLCGLGSFCVCWFLLCVLCGFLLLVFWFWLFGCYWCALRVLHMLNSLCFWFWAGLLLTCLFLLVLVTWFLICLIWFWLFVTLLVVGLANSLVLILLLLGALLNLFMGLWFVCWFCELLVLMLCWFCTWVVACFCWFADLEHFVFRTLVYWCVLFVACVCLDSLNFVWVALLYCQVVCFVWWRVFFWFAAVVIWVCCFGFVLFALADYLLVSWFIVWFRFAVLLMFTWFGLYGCTSFRGFVDFNFVCLCWWLLYLLCFWLLLVVGCCIGYL